METILSHFGRFYNTTAYVRMPERKLCVGNNLFLPQNGSQGFYIYIYKYIYICRERERERERVCVWAYLCVYVNGGVDGVNSEQIEHM